MGLFSFDLIVERTRALGMKGKVTVSHAFCLGTDPAFVDPLIEQLAELDIAIMTTAPASRPAPPVKKLLQAGVQTWCEANRKELCGTGKTANLITGEVQWRARPPSVTIRGAEVVLENLKSLGLERFVRVKEEANKEAMLNEPDAVRGVAGITINSGVEDFTITPFEVSAET